MAYEFKFPDVGEGITEGEVVKWLVKEGDVVKEDQIIVNVETDKAIVELPSPKSGTILKLNKKPGEIVKVGESLCTIGEAGEKVVEKKVVEEVGEKEEKFAAVVGEIPARAELITREAPLKGVAPAKPEVAATPAVRNLAKELGVDLTRVKGSGAGGRVTEDDVRKAAERPAAPKITKREYDLYGYIERVPVRGVRRTTAKRMKESLQRAAPVTHMDEADVTALFEHREKEKGKATEKGVHLTYLPFIIKAVIAALKEHPYLNSTFDNEKQEIVLKKYFNIGVAVDTPDGLIVPVIKIADSKSILDLAKEIEELADKAAKRKLDLAELKGGTFTITNIGVFGGTYSTPIINPPEVAILGVGKIKDRVALVEAKLVIRKVLPLSLTFDHRVLDGAEAARFMNDVIKRLEDPDLLLVA